MTIFIVMALSWLSAGASRQGEALAETLVDVKSDSLTVSLITCYPGPEIFELYGHEAIRVRGEGMDSVWNYGVFNFREPNFVYRFVKGETDYICAGYPFECFLPEYISRGSKVVEQDLDMTQEEAHRLLKLLQTEALPQNRKYRYNYVKDNCATRIIDRIDEAYGHPVEYPAEVNYSTYRNEMRHYNRNYPWYQFGIDLALGSGIDYSLTGREEMFVPIEMMNKAAAGRLGDGRPLVNATRVLNEGRGDVTLPPTPWYLSPLFCAIAVFLIVSGICGYDLKKKKISRLPYSLWFILLGLAGTLTAFLVFISSHEATSPNALIFWLNPFQLLFAVCVWWRKLRPLAVAMAYYNIVAMICLLVVWPFQHQSANPAIFPLIAATLILSATYAIIIHKDSYNKK